jgi:hypothetical protein
LRVMLHLTEDEDPVIQKRKGSRILPAASQACLAFLIRAPDQL